MKNHDQLFQFYGGNRASNAKQDFMFLFQRLWLYKLHIIYQYNYHITSWLFSMLRSFLGMATDLEKAILDFYQSILLPYIAYLIIFLDVSLLYTINLAKKMKLKIDPTAKTAKRTYISIDYINISEIRVITMVKPQLTQRTICIFSNASTAYSIHIGPSEILYPIL